MNISSSNYRTFYKATKQHNITFEHFKGQAHGKPSVAAKPDNEVFVKNSTYAASGIRRRILKDKLLPYCCDICGLNPTWQGCKLTLSLDHKSGVNTDHRLSNLRFLCPNCHSQTETYAGGNKNNPGNKNMRP